MIRNRPSPKDAAEFLGQPCIGTVLVSVLVSSLAIAPFGCGGPRGKMPVYPVRGKVFIDGQPAAGADIVLYPTTPLTDMDADYPRAGVANDGTYAIGTYGQADGAPAGRYMVSIYKGGDSSDEGPQFKKPRTVDPFRKFKDPANSGLTLEVSEGKNDGKDFDLKSTRY